MYEILGRKETFDRLLKKIFFFNQTTLIFCKRNTKQMKTILMIGTDFHIQILMNLNLRMNFFGKIMTYNPGEWGDGPWGYQHKNLLNLSKFFGESGEYNSELPMSG
jgi:hypothetical protein